MSSKATNPKYNAIPAATPRSATVEPDPSAAAVPTADEAAPTPPSKRNVDLGLTIVDVEALAEILRVAARQDVRDVDVMMAGQVGEELGWQTYYIWAPALLPLRGDTTFAAPTLPDGSELETLREEVLRHLTFDQRIACRGLLFAALGAKAVAECDLITGTLLPPPFFAPPVPDHVNREYILTLVSLLEAREALTVKARRRRNGEETVFTSLNPSDIMWFLCTSIAMMPTTAAVQLGYGYTGVHRAASRRLCQLFSIPFVGVVVAAEKHVCMAIIAAANVDQQENEDAAQQVLDGPNASRSKLSRRLKIGALIAVGGVACVVTGGLAAAAIGPALVGLAGAVGSASAAVASAGAASAVFVTVVAVVGHAAVATLLVAPVVTSTAFPTVFGAYGATLTGYRAARRVGGVSHFRLRHVPSPEAIKATNVRALEAWEVEAKSRPRSKHSLALEAADAVGEDDDENSALVAHGPATKIFVGAEKEQRRGIDKLVATITRERAAMRGAIVDIDEVDIAHANLASETPYRCVAALAIVNRVGEHVALAARRSQEQPMPAPPPVEWRVVRRITVTGTCRFAPVSHVPPRKAGVTIWHNRPRFPTGAEAIVVLRPVLKATPTAREIPIGEDDLWVYVAATTIGNHVAAGLVLPSAHTDADIHGLVAADRPVEEDDNLDAMVVTDIDVGNYTDHVDADEVLDTADDARFPEQVHERRRTEMAAGDQLLARYVTRLQEAASEEVWTTRTRSLVFRIEPGKLTVATLRMTADEFAESEITAKDRGYRDHDEATIEAHRALSVRNNAAALANCKEKACVIVSHGAEDEVEDASEDDESGGIDGALESTQRQLSSYTAMSDSSFVVDKIHFWHAEPLPIVPPSGTTTSDRFTTFPTDRTPRELPLRRSIVLPFRDADNASLPVVGLVKPIVMVVRLRHKRLDTNQRALFLITAVTTKGTVEYAMKFDRDDTDLQELAKKAKRKVAPSAKDERDYKNHLPALDLTDPTSAGPDGRRTPRFSVTVVMESDDDRTIKYVIVDELRRRRREAKRRMSLTVAISGFTLFFNPGRPLAEQQRIVWERRLQRWSAAAGSERYVLEWEPALLQDFGHFLDSDIFDSLSEMGIQKGVGAVKTAAIQAAAAAVATFLSAIALPTKALKMLSYIDNCIAVLNNRSRAAGKELAAALLGRGAGCRPVTLIGYSFGAVVAFECARRLVEVGRGNLIDGLYLLGATCPVPESTWRELRRAIPGRIVNVYYTWDIVLATFLKANAIDTAANAIAGLNPVPIPGIENIDASSIVKAHTDYAVRLHEVLDLIPDMPSASSMHPAGHNPGVVVLRNDWESASASLCAGALPTPAPFRMARGLSSAVAFSLSVSSCMLTAPSQGVALNPFSKVSLVLEKDRLIGPLGESLPWAYAPPHAVPPGKSGVFVGLSKTALTQVKKNDKKMKKPVTKRTTEGDDAEGGEEMADMDAPPPPAHIGAMVLYRVEAAAAAAPTAAATTATAAASGTGTRGGMLGHLAIFAVLVDGGGSSAGDQLPVLKVSAQLLPPSSLAALRWLDFLELQQLVGIASVPTETSFPDLVAPLVSFAPPKWNVFDTDAPRSASELEATASQRGGTRRQSPPPAAPTAADAEDAVTRARWQAAQIGLALKSLAGSEAATAAASRGATPTTRVATPPPAPTV